MNTPGLVGESRKHERSDTSRPSTARRRLGALALFAGIALTPAASCGAGTGDKPTYTGPTFVQDPEAHCKLTAKPTGGLTYSFHIDARTAAGRHGSTIGPRTEVIFVPGDESPGAHSAPLRIKNPHHAVSDFPYAYLDNHQGDHVTAIAKIADRPHPAPPTNELPGMECRTSFVIGHN